MPTPTFYAWTQALRGAEQDSSGPSHQDSARRGDGELRPDERYVQSSRGPWHIDLDTRYVLTDKGREAIR